MNDWIKLIATGLGTFIFGWMVLTMILPEEPPNVGWLPNDTFRVMIGTNITPVEIGFRDDGVVVWRRR